MLTAGATCIFCSANDELVTDFFSPSSLASAIWIS